MDGGPECDSLIEKVVRGVGSGLVGLHLRVGLTGKSFTISRNWLALGGTVPRGSAGPHMSRHQNEKACLIHNL